MASPAEDRFVSGEQLLQLADVVDGAAERLDFGHFLVGFRKRNSLPQYDKAIVHLTDTIAFALIASLNSCLVARCDVRTPAASKTGNDQVSSNASHLPLFLLSTDVAIT